MTSARHARACVTNAEAVVALEAFAAAQALEFRAPLVPGVGSRAALAAIRERIPFLAQDREIRADLAAAIELIRSGSLVGSVELAVGPLA
jgi:histidine ammonia-lyase